MIQTTTLEQHSRAIIDNLEAIARDPELVRRVLEQRDPEQWRWGTFASILAGINNTPELLTAIATAVIVSAFTK